MPPANPFRVLAGAGLDCTGKPDPMKAYDALKPRNSAKLETSPLVSEQVKAITFSEAFRSVAFNSAKKHQDTTSVFQDQAKKFDKLAIKAPSLSPKTPAKNSSKSDIPGADQKQLQPPPAQQAAQPSGGQSSPGGGSPGGGGAANQGSAGATAGTPPSFNNSSGTQSTEPAKGTASEVGMGTPIGGSRTGEATGPLPLPDVETVLGGALGAGSALTSSRSPSDGNSGRSSSSKAASIGATGGGAGGLSGATSAKPCLGTDCQQAMGNMKTNQFASVGSLGGGGGGGLGLDGDIGSLDSLFKADDLSKIDPLADGALNGFGSLDSSLDSELGGEFVDGSKQSAGGGEIGKSESRDLFVRVRSYHVRALKRGLLVGVPKKL